jgi:uncharacterized protein YcbK (DUF882 family)
MGDISRNFSRHEFSCNCRDCDFDTVDAELITVLEKAREYFKRKINVTSGARCTLHNMRVGGSVKSQHLYGKAADIQVEGVNPHAVAEYFRTEYPDKYGIGQGDSFTHVDVRPNKARWKYS